jgi:hypothetical protein
LRDGRKAAKCENRVKGKSRNNGKSKVVLGERVTFPTLAMQRTRVEVGTRPLSAGNKINNKNTRSTDPLLPKEGRKWGTG